MTVIQKAAALWLSTLALATGHAQPDAAKPTALLFDPIARVVMHPRSINCHQVDAPRQTDLSTGHTQGVVRGKGGPARGDPRCRRSGSSTRSRS